MFDIPATIDEPNHTLTLLDPNKEFNAFLTKKLQEMNAIFHADGDKIVIQLKDQSPEQFLNALEQKADMSIKLIDPETRATLLEGAEYKKIARSIQQVELITAQLAADEISTHTQNMEYLVNVARGDDKILDIKEIQKLLSSEEFNKEATALGARSVTFTHSPFGDSLDIQRQGLNASVNLSEIAGGIKISPEIWKSPDTQSAISDMRTLTYTKKGDGWSR